jgi:hypothetical protein
MRLEAVRRAIQDLGPDATAAQITAAVYTDIDESVRWAAERSVQAQLEFLRGEREN